ncbi:MAG: class I SAM-dependent methyltransferase [Syntrophomonadaceae bacterium]
MSKLTARLGLLAAMTEPGHSIADIGADHARLALYLVEQGISPRVIISELGEGPWSRAGRAIQSNPCQGRVELRRGNGLQVLLPGEVDQVVLAGMGGDTIVEILGYDWDKAATFRRFLFQPMTRPKTLRESLSAQGWRIEEERVVREEKRLYIVIAARPGQSAPPLSPLELEVGPLILKADDELKREYISQVLKKLRSVYRQMINSPRADIVAAAAVYREQTDRLEEVLDAGYSEGHS